MLPHRVSLAVMAFLIAALTAGADELKTLGGKSVEGKLKRIDADSIVIEAGNDAVSTPLSQALLLEFRQSRPHPDGDHYEVRLIDDSALFAKYIAYSGKDVQITLASGGQVKVPLSSLVWVLKDPQNPTIKKQFQNVLKAKTRSDRILIFKEGELNAIDGILGEIGADGKTIAFKREGNEGITPRLDLLQGMTFFRTEVPKDSAVCKVVSVDGDLLMATKLEADGTMLTATTPLGAKVPLKNETLARLDFNLGRLTFLSDVEPSKLSDTEFLGGFPTYRKDVNQDGRPIVLLNQNFAKGITLEGGVTVEYNLNGKYKDFKAMVGVDTRAAEGALGKTTVVVYADGEKKLTVGVSPTELKPIALNVKDVGTLRIVVEGPNFTGLSAYVTLADARISQ